MKFKTLSIILLFIYTIGNSTTIEQLSLIEYPNYSLETTIKSLKSTSKTAFKLTPPKTNFNFNPSKKRKYHQPYLIIINWKYFFILSTFSTYIIVSLLKMYQLTIPKGKTLI